MVSKQIQQYYFLHFQSITNTTILFLALPLNPDTTILFPALPFNTKIPGFLIEVSEKNILYV